MSILVTHADGLCRIALNRPEKRNAMDAALVAGLCAAITAAGDDATVKAVLVSGEGRQFSAGADLAEIAANPGDPERAGLTRWMLQVPRGIGKPVVAAVHGMALGAAASFALACDAIVMAEDAQLGWPEARHRMLPRVVAPQVIAAVPAGVAFDLLATGRPMPALEAFALGLAARIVAPEALIAEASAYALGAALLPPAALAELKRMIRP